jgi:hypothetical protein
MYKDVIIYETVLLHRDYGKLLQTNRRIASAVTGKEGSKLNEKKPSDILAVRSAVCSAAYPLYGYVLIVLGAGADPIDTLRYLLPQLVVWMAFAAFAYFRKKNAGLIVAAVVFFLFGDIFPHLTLFYLFNFLAVLSLLIIITFACIPVLRSIVKIKKNVGYLPVIFIVIKNVIRIWIMLPYLSIDYIPAFPFYLIEILAFLFLGLWVNNRESVAASEQIAGQRNESGASDPYGYINGDSYSSTDDKADRLKIYEVLLEGGAISPEEFEKKKKEIMRP